MNIPSRKWVVLAACSAALGAGAVFALAANGKLAPPADEKPANEDWLPKPRALLVDGKNKLEDWIAAPPSAFPELAIPEDDPKDPKAAEKREEQFKKLCPRLCGKTELKIEPTDDGLRKLLKARLHQGVWELIGFRDIIRRDSWNAMFREQLATCLIDVCETAAELFAGQPKERVAWLEECLVQAKELERFHRLRVLQARDPWLVHNAAVRNRLKVEEMLLSAKK